MSEAKVKKLQYLLVSQLLETGSVKLVLPDGVTLDIGIMQEDRNGRMTKSDDYCCVVASRDGKSAMIDSYNLGLTYRDQGDTIVCEGEATDHHGWPIRTLDVV